MIRKQNPSFDHFAPRPDHRPRWVRPRQHDTYARAAKYVGAVVCEGCGAVFHAGRWRWSAPPLTELEGGVCPACARTRDHYPVGTLRVPARFLDRREEVLGLIHNAEAAEIAEHPLERLMDVVEQPDGDLVVRTTGIHLARSITHRLERRFHEEARLRYPREQNLLVVDWES